MESSFRSPPAKRPMQELNNPHTVVSKRRSKPTPPPLSIPPGHVSLRLLCHVSKIGGVIGKSGSVVKLFRQETGAKIRIEETVAACDERVILVVAPDNPKKMITLKGLDENSGEVEQYEVSPAQEAFVRVFERVLEVEAESEGIFPPPGGAITCRLLALSGQIGAVMGKGGKMIEKIRKDSGARIKVLPPAMLPACASDRDELIQILGDVLAVKKALVAISSCLQDNPPTEKDHLARSRPVGTTLPGTYPDIYGERQSSLLHTHGNAFDYPSRVDYASSGRPMPIEFDRASELESNNQQEVSFRLLCSTDTVGGVIGRGGSIVKTLQENTGAIISVGSSVTETDERVITISAKENPESEYSPAQNATVRVFSRSVEAGNEKGLNGASNNGTSVSARLLVASKEVGCLMGKGGAIMQEMRKSTGTGIKIIGLGGDKATKGASENDQVVQIVGEFRGVQDAVFHVTSRLRDNLFSTKTFKPAGPGNYSSYAGPDISHHGRLREPTSTGLYPSHGLSHNIDRHNILAQGMDNLGISHRLDRPRSPQLWGTHTLSGGITDAGRGLTSLRGGLDFGSGKSAIVTNTTVEILVPDHILGSVYGDNRNNLNRLRQISGAKVVMHEPRPGTNDAIVIISGTPDQTQAAQSLLQAFISSG